MVLALGAIEPLPQGDWAGGVCRAAKAAGLGGEPERQRVRIAGTRAETGAVQFSDDIVLSRLWLAKDRHALAATPHRRYFDRKTGEVDARSERQIVGQRRPAGPTSAQTIHRIHELLGSLRDELNGDTGFVDVEKLVMTAPRICIGSHESAPDSSLNDLHKQYGFDRVPDDWLITVCPLENVGERRAADIADRIRRVARQRSARAWVQTAGPAAIADRLRQIGSTPPALGRSVLFVLPSKLRPAHEASINLMAAMDAAGVSYRRSYADDPLDFSVPDQFPSILQSSGGAPHRVVIEDPSEAPWSLGLDLSHSRDRAKSILACALVAPDGSLSATWTVTQKRDETPGIRTLVKVLYAVRDHLQRQGAADDPIVVIRDGRLFERESTTAFSNALGNPYLLLEYRKRRNPPVLHISDAPTGLDPPFGVGVPGADTLFLAPTPARNTQTLPAVAKVTWRARWNRLGWSPDQIASFLGASALTPGLGLHRRTLPGALYWADGIAGASDQDLRFRGNAPVVL